LGRNPKDHPAAITTAPANAQIAVFYGL